MDTQTVITWGRSHDQTCNAFSSLNLEFLIQNNLPSEGGRPGERGREGGRERDGRETRSSCREGGREGEFSLSGERGREGGRERERGGEGGTTFTVMLRY